MRVERLYENCWAILDGLRIVASGFARSWRSATSRSLKPTFTARTMLKQPGPPGAPTSSGPLFIKGFVQ
jgi:hypothetical protein